MTKPASSLLRPSRRDLLRGLGAGAVLLAPFARSRRLDAAPAADGNLLVFFTPNGFARDKFDAVPSAGGGYTFKPSLAALEPHRSNVSVIRGLCNKSASTKSSHEDCVKILTCVSGADTSTGYGPSIDQVVAKQFGGRPLTLAVEKFNAEPNWQTKISWVQAGAFEPHVKSTKAVFDNVFGNFMPPMAGDATRAPDPVLAQNKSVLDFVRGDISLFKSRLSKADQAKLDLHLDALREVEKRVATTPDLSRSGNTGACAINGLSQRASAAQLPDQVDNLKAQGETMLDLVATSFACGLKRSATLFWQPASDGINPNRGGGNHHQVSHYEAPNSAQQWPAIDAWYADRFKYAIEALASRGVLDDTVVVWVTEISESHNQNDFVNVVAGGKNLGIKLGQYLKYPFVGDEGGGVSVGRDARNKSQAELWVSIQKALGIAQDTFGDVEHSSGGLTELWSG